MSSSEPDQADVLDHMTNATGDSSVDLLSNEMQSILLNGNDNTMLSPASDVSNLSFFNLLESVSPSLQADLLPVLLEKCTVLELSSLAVVSRSLRKGALAAMAKRSLDVWISRSNNDEDEEYGDYYSTYMFIVDRTDSSRNVKIEFSECVCEDECWSKWNKIRKFISFCGRANFIRMYWYVYIDPIRGLYFPTKFVMKSEHCISTEVASVEVFVDRLEAFGNFAELLDFVSPRVIKYDIHPLDAYLLDLVFYTRGMMSADSIILACGCPDGLRASISDEKVQTLKASSISIYSAVLGLVDVGVFKWTAVGISKLIEQWLNGGRVIEHLQSILQMSSVKLVRFGPAIVEALLKLNGPPKIDISTTLDDGLKARLQTIDGNKIYHDMVSFSPKAYVIHLTAHDGRQLTIVVSKGCYEFVSRDAGFIDIFPTI